MNATNKSGETALMMAVEANNKAIAEALLEKGANVNAQNRSGKTVFCIA